MRMNATLATLACGLAASLVMSSAASAVTLKWTLVNAVFDDGGVATGSFNYNTVTEAYTDIDIVTTAGTAAAGYTFNAFDVASTVRDYGFGSNVAGMTLVGDPLLDINTTSDFNTPGMVSIGPIGVFVSSQGTCATDGCTLYNPLRSLSGSVFSSAVPEPAMWTLMLSGIGGVGLMLRRSKKVQDSAA